MNSHGTFNGEDYPLHVQLDNRTQTNGTVYVEQLISSTQMAIYRNNASWFVWRNPEKGSISD